MTYLVIDYQQLLPLWEHGLKHEVMEQENTTDKVAPFMGAWIETRSRRLRYFSLSKLLPLWEHGLKQVRLGFCFRMQTLLPLWEHGLKPMFPPSVWDRMQVAPFMGAWIETVKWSWIDGDVLVAPFMGAWIETLILNGTPLKKSAGLLPLWEHGLKPCATTNQELNGRCSLYGSMD